MAKRKKKLTKSEALIQLTEKELNAMTKVDLARAYKTLRTTYGKRKSAFQKADEFSYAIERYEREVAKSPKIPVSKMTRSRLAREVAMLRHMLQGETATVEGAREQYRLQDIRLFGKIEGTELPQFSMSSSAREAFWDAYDEWQRDPKIMGLGLQSGEEQRQLADIMFSGLTKRKNFFPELEGTEEGDELVRFTELPKSEQGGALYNYLAAFKRGRERMEFAPNVYTGRGSNF